MKEKNKSSNWYIAATHYITAGFAIPFIIYLIATVLLRALSLSFLSNILLLTLFLLIVRILAIWLGTMYSANYLGKAYIIEDKNKITNLATIYFVVLNLGYLLFQISSSRGIIGGALSGTDIAYSFLSFVIAAVLFYVFSKKYVKNSEAESQIR